jgi:heme/copper-type cytochrome/quinol oxidase subunit 2
MANNHFHYLIHIIIIPGSRFVVYGSDQAAAKASSAFNIFFGAVLSFTIILFSNISIVATLRKASSERGKLGKKSTECKRLETTHLTIMLMFVSAAYIVTTLPYRLLDPIFEVPEIKAMYDMTQLNWRLRYGVAGMTVMTAFFCNYGINFYLYCIGGGRRYRNDTKEVIGNMFKFFCRRLNEK